MAVTGDSLALGLAAMAGYSYWKLGVLERKLEDMRELLGSLKEMAGHTMGEVRDLHHRMIDAPELERIVRRNQ